MTKKKISKSDRLAIVGLAHQDVSGEVDDSYSRTGDAVDTIRRWQASCAQAGDAGLGAILARVGVRAAAVAYASARQEIARRASSR